MSHQILIVEDEPTVRENLADFLEDEGFSVLQAPDAEVALTLLNEHTPDLAIVDIRLPGMDGNAWMLQAHEQMSQMKFIVYTGFLDYKLPEQVREIGLTEADVLVKPLGNMSEISSIIIEKLKKE
jgi:two-component system, OmpR family, response regulator